MAILVNDYLSIEIREKGAELSSVFHKTHQIEYIWQGDQSVWGWHAPNLFPVVGGCIHDQLQINGQSYPMHRHGFARHSQFRVVENTATHAKFSLIFNEDTLEVYPYRFEFQILYDLFGEELRISYKVINLDDQTIYFSVGGHPAFNAPFFPNEKQEDYYLEFEKDELLQAHLLSASGFFTGKTDMIPTNGKDLPLTPGLFDRDALVFKDLQSKVISLRSKNHAHFIKVKYHEFDCLGIWAKPGAPFVCIEPWLGCADSEGEAVDISKKEAIEQLAHGHVFEAVYSLSFLNQ